MKKMIFTLFVMVLLCVYIPGVARSEQTVSLPGHYSLNEISAVSFPSSSVHILNHTYDGTVLDVMEPFHVICVNVGNGQIECVSSLETRGLYVYGTFGDSCFAPDSADPRFKIATPIPDDNTCILDAVITKVPGFFERSFNPEQKEEAVSRWSVNAPRLVKRVNAYERIVEIMKRKHIDFTNQILTIHDLPMSFRDFQDMIVADITKSKDGPFDQLADDIKVVSNFVKDFERDLQRVMFPLFRNYGDATRVVNYIIMRFEGVIRDVYDMMNRTCMNIHNVLTLNGMIPIETYNNPILILVFIAMVLTILMMVVNTIRFFLSWAKPIICIFTFLFFFYFYPPLLYC